MTNSRTCVTSLTMLPLLLLLPLLPIAALGVFLIFLILRWLYIMPSLSSVATYFYSTITHSYNYLTGGEAEIGDKYTIVRHCRPFVVYQGLKTTVPVTILGNDPLPANHRVFLQKRGYRTGLLGWTIGGLLGGSKLPGIEVTPVSSVSYSELSPSLRKRYEEDIRRILGNTNQAIQETLIVHVPVASGDGYFRLRVTTDNPRKTIAVSPSFRVGSFTWASAQTQGASPMGIVPELLVRGAFISVKASAYAAFYAAFPVIKIAEYTPGPWRRYALRLASDRLGVTDQIRSANDRLRQTQDDLYRKVPFGTVGVRSWADIEKDENMGRGGTAYAGPKL